MAKVVLSHKGMRELLNDPGVRAELHRRADLVAARAKATAPVDTGAYRDSIEIEDDTTDRAVVRIIAKDRKSHIIEARTGNLAKALGAD